MYLRDLRYGYAFLHMGMDIGVIDSFSFIVGTGPLLNGRRGGMGGTTFQKLSHLGVGTKFFAKKGG